MRSATFTLRKPVPTGVVIGPLMATLFFRIESSTCVGERRPVLVHDVRAGVLDVPVELHAGAFEHPAGRFGDLGTGPVAGDQGDAMNGLVT